MFPACLVPCDPNPNSNPYPYPGRQHPDPVILRLPLCPVTTYDPTPARAPTQAGNTELRVPVYGSGVRLIVGGTNGSNVGTDAEEPRAQANPHP